MKHEHRESAEARMKEIDSSNLHPLTALCHMTAILMMQLGNILDRLDHMIEKEKESDEQAHF